MKNERKNKWKGGRPTAIDPAKNCVMVRFTDTEYAKFLAMYDKSGVYAKSIFIKARVFNESFRVVKTDLTKMKYVSKLSSFYSQFRSIGVNYNQVVKLLSTHFTERKALSSLYKLEKQTIELVKLSEKIVELCRELQERK